MTFGHRLRHERKRLGLNQAEMGAVAGVGKMSQLNYEKGTSSPDVNYLMAVAAAGVDLVFLFTGSPGAPPVLTPAEAALLADFEAADEHGKAVIEGTARLAVGKRA